MDNMKDLAAILRGLTPQQTSELAAELGIPLGHQTPRGQQVMARDIRSTLSEMGAPASNKGYEYIVSAVMLILERPGILEAVTKDLYPQVAAQHGTTGSRVERAIRHEVECIMDNQMLEAYQEKHPDFQTAITPAKGKPTNSEFLASLYQYFRD